MNETFKTKIKDFLERFLIAKLNSDHFFARFECNHRKHDIPESRPQIQKGVGESKKEEGVGRVRKE
jgi:hypothetical protein